MELYKSHTSVHKHAISCVHDIAANERENSMIGSIAFVNDVVG